MGKNFMDALTSSRLQPKVDKEAYRRRLLNKWTKTGLLSGLPVKKQLRVATLFENQAEQLVNQVHMLREATSMSGGNIEGYATSVFPMIRRIYGDMTAENLIGIQTMDKPFGYLMFIDYIYTQDRMGYKAGQSIFGGGRVGADITLGLDLDNSQGFYNLNEGVTKPTIIAALAAGVVVQPVNPANDSNFRDADWSNASNLTKTAAELVTDGIQADVRNDVDVLNPVMGITWHHRRYIIQLTAADFGRFSHKTWQACDLSNLITVPPSPATFGASAEIIKRLTTVDETNRQVLVIMRATDPLHLPLSVPGQVSQLQFPINDLFIAGSSMGAIQGSDWHFEGTKNRAGFEAFPEFEVKINTKFIETESRQFKAIWTPQAAQDAQALADVDIETEISGTLTDHVEHEIDREILMDLVNRATAGRYHWDAQPGVFLNMLTGVPLAVQPDFTGAVDAWYRTFGNTINSLSANIHRKILKGGANFIVMGPEASTVLDGMQNWSPNAGGPDSFASELGLIKAGSLSKRFDVYVNPQFWRNMMLVGRKGGSNADAGYFYMPYVPLTLTPVIPDPDDFTPRMGIMTRYGKFMVRPDMYGLVQIHHLLMAE